MAILGINMRPTPQPREKQKDRTFTEKALDNVLTAAKIAEVGFGIHSKYKEMDLEEKRLDIKDKFTMQEQEQNLAKAFRLDPTVLKIQEQYEKANQITDIAKSNPRQLGYAAMLMSTIRSAAGGTVTDQEIAIFNPDPSYIAKMQRYMNEKVEGTPRKEDIKAYAELGELLKQIAIRRMNVRAGMFAETEGRRIGTKDHVVNKILRPQSRLTGAAEGEITYRPQSVEGLEGKDAPGQTRVRFNQKVPTDNSPQVEDIVQKYNEGNLDKRITAEAIDALIRKSRQAGRKPPSRGQAIWMLDQRLRLLDAEKARRNKDISTQPGAKETKGMMDSMQNFLGN
jgi:hypothetical protein